ncbi:thiamine-phosphate kinase [Magnetovirga frankeli]|uniref:thiamine-phosphate kinase n=1 Tax=Magnetovirga frankeli TaxID=947516 RepID=UPI001293AAFD|nr:thiamine-phosphate kinase [gamma proteobacterium SS-5]
MFDSEFDLIARYFSHLGASRSDVLLGVGDDCALLRPPPGMDLALSTDTLVAGQHFFADVDPEALGHKCLAVNLSDLAAMGARPAWASLALTLPEVDHAWLAGFAQGLGQLAEQAGIALVGGDTTRGALSIGIQVQGLLPAGQGLRRSGAQAGDLICVSGSLGEAALALRQLQQGLEPEPGMRQRLERPRPRLRLGQRLLGLAHACIDISDGLLADLGHICSASGLAAEIQLADLPCAPQLKTDGDWCLPLSGGDDYELCFTLAADQAERLPRLAAELGLPLSIIGRMRAGQGIDCRLADGSLYRPSQRGFDHFHDSS